MLVPEDGKGSDVIRGALELLILRTLQLGPMHGWGSTELIEQRSRRLLAVNQGSLYPALYQLVRDGMLASEWDTTDNNRKARYYRLTAAGREHLAQERGQWKRLSPGVNLVLAPEAT